MPFKLQRVSSATGEQRQLAPTTIIFSFTPSNTSLVLKVPGHFGSAPVHFLVDSGAAISVARYDVVPATFQSILSGISDTVALSASGHSLDVVGKAVLPITVGSIEFEHEFTIVRNLTVDALLGVDFLTRHQATVDCVKGCLTLAAEEVPFIHTGSDSCQPSGTASFFLSYYSSGDYCHPRPLTSFCYGTFEWSLM